jgi:O-antigen/teichoic acid export membrane protein
MFRKISITFISKAINALLGFANTIILTQNLGTEGKGLTTIFMSNLAFCMLFCHIIGGNSVIYLASRYNKYKLLLPSYVWEIFISFFMAWLLYVIGICPKDYWVELGIISMLYSLFNTHLLILLGNENTIIYNVLVPLPLFLQLIMSFVLFYIFNLNDINWYLMNLYTVFIVSYLISLLVLIPKLKVFQWTDLKSIKQLWFYGIKSQLSNILHFLNNRIIFYVLGYYFLKSEVGIYSVGVALIEVVFLIGNSISIMIYTKIANTKSIELSKSITNLYIKVSLLFTLFALVFLLLIDEKYYALIFGEGFEQAKLVVLYLSPGAFMMSIYLVTSCYFSGIGQYQFNNYASGLGFITLLIGSYFYFPSGNIITAAIITSAAFSVISISSFLMFKFKTVS